jgi:hypothetical protein
MKPENLMWIYKNIVERIIAGVVGISQFIGVLWFSVYLYKHLGYWSFAFVVPIGLIVAFVGYTLVMAMRRTEKRLRGYLRLEKGGKETK